MKHDVIVCGSLHLDIVVQAPCLPALDETVVGRSWRTVCGGKGRNQAVQAAAAGARVAMIGRVGRDEFGDRLLASLDTACVDRAEVEVDPAAGSGMSVAIVDAAGDYGAVIVSGVNLATDPAGVEAAVARLLGATPEGSRPQGSGVLVLQNELPEAANLAAAQAMRRRGGRIVLNAAPTRAIGDALLAQVDVLVVNRVEAGQLAEAEVTDPASAVSAARVLANSARSVVVTLGGQGLVLVRPGLADLLLPARKVAVTSTHGAGDCFVGAMAASLAAGADLAAACEIANAAAARHVCGPPVL